MLMAMNLADASVRIASPNRTERDRAEGESPQLGLAWAARLVRHAAARGGLDDQDGQLPVSQVVFPRPCPQRLDDVGDMVSTGVRLPMSLPRARCLQLNLEARHVQARRIRVASTRRRPVLRRNHVPAGSPGAPQSDGVRRAVIEGFSFLEVPGAKAALPSRAGGPSPSMRARPATTRKCAAATDRPKQCCPHLDATRHPLGIFVSIFTQLRSCVNTTRKYPR